MSLISYYYDLSAEDSLFIHKTLLISYFIITGIMLVYKDFIDGKFLSGLLGMLFSPFYTCWALLPLLLTLFFDKPLSLLLADIYIVIITIVVSIFIKNFNKKDTAKPTIVKDELVNVSKSNNISDKSKIIPHNTNSKKFKTKLNPIIFGNDIIKVHPLLNDDSIKLENITKDLLELYSNKKNVEYIPEKYETDIKTIENYLLGFISSAILENEYNLFINFKEYDKVIGMIKVISPNISKTKGIENTWLIEYILDFKFWGNGLMTGLMEQVLISMKNQGIITVGAFVHIENIGSIKVLEKLSFERNPIKPQFDHYYYELKL